MHHVQGQLDPYLVLLSTLIAFAASYTALDLATRIRSATPQAARAWLAAAAVAMGGGIWSMHFVAMLALRASPPISYDIGLTILSLLIAISVTGVALALASSAPRRDGNIAIPSILMGVGIAAMHYAGTFAMRVPGGVTLSPPLVAASLAVAIAASYWALRIATGVQPLRLRLAGGALMGLAVTSMHHVGMAATSWATEGDPIAETTGTLAQTSLAMAVAATTFVILLLGLAASLYDRRTAEASVREALLARQIGEGFRALYRRTPLPLHTVDAEGAIEDVSDAWLSLMGYGDRSEVAGRPITDFMSPIDARIRADRDWPELLSTGHIAEREMQFVRRDGSPVHVMLSAQVERGEDGTFLRSMEGIVDVTGRKVAEAGLRQAQKMEAVGQLTGGIAHDFNNLLMIVGSALTMIERGRPAERYIPGMRQAVERASGLTKQLLAFSRKESLNPEVMEITTRLRDIREMLAQSLNPGISLAVEPCDECWRTEVDPGEFDLALLNLVVNARDAMPDGGALSIRASNRVARPEPGAPAEEYVVVEVRDTGVGMDRAVMARVFEPFFTTKPAGKGTGLGLSHVYGFARQSGGFVTIDSEPGKGTAISIHLPRSLKEAKPKAAAAGVVRAYAERGLVLLVEDTPGVAVATSAMLGEIGYSVVHAGDADEALARLEENGDIEFVLSDIVMPGMNGIGLARKVAERRPDVPILLMTGYSRALEDEGEFEIIRKPFQIDALEQRMRAIASRGVNSAA